MTQSTNSREVGPASPPALTDDQRTAALAKAVEVRRRHAALKHSLKTGTVNLAQILCFPPDDAAAKMKVLAALEALPRVGKVRARRIMERLDISETRRLQGLGQKQRELLLREFE